MSSPTRYAIFYNNYLQFLILIVKVDMPWQVIAASLTLLSKLSCNCQITCWEVTWMMESLFNFDFDCLIKNFGRKIEIDQKIIFLKITKNLIFIKNIDFHFRLFNYNWILVKSLIEKFWKSEFSILKIWFIFIK